VESLKKELADKTAECEETQKKFRHEVDDLKFNNSSLERKNKSLEDELNCKQEEVAGLKMTVAQLTSSQVGVETELKQTKKMLKSSQNDVADLSKLNSEKDAKIEVYEEKERAFETERRKLHNIIQELKVTPTSGNCMFFVISWYMVSGKHSRVLPHPTLASRRRLQRRWCHQAHRCR
jgi:chromosome segregation ATPase